MDVAAIDGKLMGTRVEVKFVGSRIPKGIKRWSDLPKMGKLNPFSNLKQLPIGDELPFRLDDKEIPPKVYAYLYLAEKTSGPEAKRLFNKNGGHFRRDVGRYLIEHENIDFAAAWRSRCERFFGEAAHNERGSNQS